MDQTRKHAARPETTYRIELAGMGDEDSGLVDNRFGAFARRAILVRHAEQVYGRPRYGEAEREKPGGSVEGLIFA